jgi:hypothetical protein
MKTTERVTWLVNRLRCMSVPEVAFRASRAVELRVQSVNPRPPRIPPPAPLPAGRRLLFAQTPLVDREPYLAAAGRIMEGKLTVFAHEDMPLGFPPQWNTDPLTQRRAPLRFGKRLDYRDESLVGNIKTLWEPSRHLHLVTLAQAHALSGNARFAEACRTTVDSWIEQCPYPLGVHWSSSLELGIRLLNWAVTWELLGGDEATIFRGSDGQAFRRRWLDSVYLHCHFIEGFLSRHSSANNHLLGEWMGLFIASTVWPCWPRSERWQAKSRAGFVEEALKQNAADGVNLEQAVYYHHEVADMMLLAGLFARAAGRDFPPAFWQRLEAMMEFVVALMDVGGNVPAIGDADDALMLRLHQSPHWCPYRSLLAASAVLFERGDFKEAAGPLDEKTLWLLGSSAPQAYAAIAARRGEPARRSFPIGGYTVLGTRLGMPDETRIVADAGPLGYLSIAAHGHADALAFTLSVAGQPILVDPGTYSYHTERTWRDYFRSTPAHNTVCVDERDQSHIGGNFMWLRKANCRLLRAEFGGERDVWEGEHDGYRCLPDPVLHRRRLELHHASGRLSVTDRLECKGAHTARFNWHFSPRVRVSVEPSGVVTARAPGILVTLTMPGDGARPTLRSGSLAPIAGWFSPAFGVKQPTATVTWTRPVDGTVEWRTEIEVRLLQQESAQESQKEESLP